MNIFDSTPETAIKVPTTEDVRKVFRLTTDWEVSPSENGTAFDMWLAQVKADAVAEATAGIEAVALNEAAQAIDKAATAQHKPAEGQYRNGHLDGMVDAATMVHRMASNVTL